MVEIFVAKRQCETLINETDGSLIQPPILFFYNPRINYSQVVKYFDFFVVEMSARRIGIESWQFTKYLKSRISKYKIERKSSEKNPRHGSLVFYVLNTMKASDFDKLT